VIVEIMEQFVAAKTGRPEQCEDGIVVTGEFAAVIDGATDKTGHRYEGMTGGRYAMLACSDALRSLDPRADHVVAAEHLTEMLARRLPDRLSPRERPEAVLTVYSRPLREIWQIGDVGFWHLGIAEGQANAHKLVDRYAADIRAAIIRVELGTGSDMSQLARNDPGRRAISSLLTSQASFRNNLAAGEFSYPGVDGNAIPASLIVIHKIPENVTQLVIASDGYPRILPTLDASEEMLARLLTIDPMCIDELRGTKGIEPGNTSFDDRAYLRLELCT
jgi:hypothetical protein